MHAWVEEKSTITTVACEVPCAVMFMPYLM
jgi:hypothetical protein